MAESANVKVFARFRPLNKREIALNANACSNLKFINGSAGVSVEGKPFNFDRCFGTDTQQADFFDTVAKSTIEDIFKGYNGTIFAYGQTGAGKTFSMMGVLGDEQLRGIIPRSMRLIFETIENAPLEVTFKVSVSYLEVYREVIRDLLDVRNSNLAVRESQARGTYVEGATTTYVANEEEVYEVLHLGDAARAVAATNMNATSSRSHSVFMIKVEQQNAEGAIKTAQLNLVDLAGSEKIAKTGATGSTLEEVRMHHPSPITHHPPPARAEPMCSLGTCQPAVCLSARCAAKGVGRLTGKLLPACDVQAKKINQSLSALSNVISALSEGKPHVPFRDSKLTRMLQQSLGGNCKTSLVVAASPHDDNSAETLSTLRFGARAKAIKTVVKVNEQKVSTTPPPPPLGSADRSAPPPHRQTLPAQLTSTPHRRRCWTSRWRSSRSSSSTISASS
jgi:kinesin family protein 5